MSLKDLKNGPISDSYSPPNLTPIRPFGDPWKRVPEGTIYLFSMSQSVDMYHWQSLKDPSDFREHILKHLEQVFSETFTRTALSAEAAPLHPMITSPVTRSEFDSVRHASRRTGHESYSYMPSMPSGPDRERAAYNLAQSRGAPMRVFVMEAKVFVPATINPVQVSTAAGVLEGIVVPRDAYTAPDRIYDEYSRMPYPEDYWDFKGSGDTDDVR